MTSSHHVVSGFSLLMTLTVLRRLLRCFMGSPSAGISLATSPDWTLDGDGAVGGDHRGVGPCC